MKKCDFLLQDMFEISFAKWYINYAGLKIIQEGINIMKYLLYLFCAVLFCCTGCRGARYVEIDNGVSAQDIAAVTPEQAVAGLKTAILQQQGPKVIHCDVNDYGFYLVQQRNPSALRGEFTVIYSDMPEIKIRKHVRSGKIFVEFIRGRRCICRLFYTNPEPALAVKKYCARLQQLKSTPKSFKPVPIVYTPEPVY